MRGPARRSAAKGTLVISQLCRAFPRCDGGGRGRGGGIASQVRGVIVKSASAAVLWFERGSAPPRPAVRVRASVSSEHTCGRSKMSRGFWKRTCAWPWSAWSSSFRKP